MEKRKDGPKISDLRDSGSIEQDADSIVFLYREPTDGNEKVSVFVAKNRNGPLGHFKLEFQGEITSFKDIPFTN